ncbi:MAG: hypothetical protein FJY97_20770 [candidate division Zixibacteria bacterium]|nr:hypothetical protein [candidate division Zixibacteria bacterium]
MQPVFHIYPAWTALAVLLTSIFSTAAQAAYDLRFSGARPAGLAGAYVALADDADSPYHNPAGMSQLRHPSLNIFYTVLYGVEGLSQHLVSGVVPTRLGPFGAYVQTLGGSLYRESDTGLAYGRFWGARLAAGVTIRFLDLSIVRYGNRPATTFDAGLLLRLSPTIRLGIATHQIRPPRTPLDRTLTPTLVRIGVSRTDGALVLGFQGEYDPRYVWTPAFGQEYRPVSALAIRAGLRTGPSQVFFGVGITVSRFEAAYAMGTHFVLGHTHRVSLTFKFSKEKP